MDSSDLDSTRGGQDDAQGRIEALRRIARDQEVQATLQKPPLPATGVSDSRRWRFWLTLALMTTLIVVVLVAIFSRATPTPTVRKSHLQAVEIMPASELIACPVDLAWSPDLSKIAVVGYSAGCAAPNIQYDTGLSDKTSKVYDGLFNATNPAYIATYDTTHGTRLGEFSPDQAIFQAMHDQSLISPAFTAWLATVNMAPEQFLGIVYTHVLWSPDRSRLLVTFTCYLPDGPPVSPQLGSHWPGHVAQGVLVANTNGQNEQVFLHVSEPQSAGAVIWDLTSGRVIGSLPPSLPFSFQPVAPAYVWNESGRLEPVVANPSASTIGEPQTGSATFAIWQPGIVGTAINSNRPGVRNLTGLAVFATNIASLSPDGHYLAASLGAASLLSPPPDGAGSAPSTSPDVATLTSYGWQSAPHLSTRDAGLQKAITLADQDGFSGAIGDTLTNVALIAWRPDGRMIAVSANTPTHAVSIIDCRNGRQVTALTPPVTGVNNTNAYQSLVEWSPDGHHLAYFDPHSGTLTLWDGSWLPA